MAENAYKSTSDPSPSELRSMFGANLRLLSSEYRSISALCRDLGINRTQYNRYLSGESFPRPDVLYRICRFFDVDARILLEPVGALMDNPKDLMNHPQIKDYTGSTATYVDEEFFPSGFYRFSRRSFVDMDQILLGMVMIYRSDGFTFLKGLEAKEAMIAQSLPTDRDSREFRGFVLRQENGIAAIVSRKNSMTCSFNFLSRETSFQNNFWVGYTTRTIRESTSTTRATRLVYEHLGDDFGDVLSAAREVGFTTIDELIPYHRRLLQLNDDFR